MSENCDNLGAGVLGMYAAVKICLSNDIDPHDLVDLMLREVFSPDGYAWRPEYAQRPIPKHRKDRSMAWNPSPEVAVARDAANKLTSHYGVKVQKCIVTFVLADDRLGCASYGVDKAHCAAAKSLADAIYEAAMDHYGDPAE